MRVLITSDQNSLFVSDVCLEQGYIPKAAGYTLFSGTENQENGKSEYLEPAIWFKVLLMDSLCINCNLRMVYWTERKLDGEGSKDEKKEEEEDKIDGETDRNEEVEEMLKSAEVVEEGSIDFVNTLEEVFDTMRLCCSFYSKKKITHAELCRLLINLLHMNILPLVKLKSSHLELLRHGMLQQEKFIEHLNDLILMKTVKLHELKESKKRNRRNLRLAIVSHSDTRWQDGLPELLEREFNLELEHNMNHLKDVLVQLEQSATTASESDHEEMKKAFQETKDEVLSLNKAIEKIRSSKKRNAGWLRKLISQLPLGDEVQLQKIYLQMHEQALKIQKEIYGMMDEKLMVSSVMESMRGVLKEMKEGGESYGLELEKRSRVHMSDILSNSFATRSFKGLPERINAILADLSHPLTADHVRMELQARNLITATLHRCQQQHLYNSLVHQLKYLGHPISINFTGHRLHSFQNLFLTDDTPVLCYEGSSNEQPMQKSQSLERLARTDDDANHRNCTQTPSFHSFIEDKENFFAAEHNFSYVTEAIEQLKEEITSHFCCLCADMQVEIDQRPNELNRRKVWVIYENYFYENVLDLLLQLYMAEYHNKVRVFAEKVTLLSLRDLDLENSNVTKLLLLGHHSKSIHILRPLETDSSTLQSSSLNSEKAIIARLGNFFDSSEEVFKSPNEDSLLSDSSDSYASDDVAVFKPAKSFDDDDDVSPALSKPASFDGKEFTPLDSLSSDGDDETYDSVKLQACILDRFEKAYACLEQVLQAKTLMKKTHYLSRCLKEVSQQLASLSSELNDKEMCVCNDELTDAIVILLCNSQDHCMLAGLYVQIKLLTDYLASFFEFGEFKFTLTIFLGVCNHLQDKIFMKDYKHFHNSLQTA